MSFEKPFKIDFVFPYVNPDDTAWKKNYNYFNSAIDKYKNTSVRFRDFSLLKYIFRSIERYAPFIDNVFMIVATEEQVPAYINKAYPKLKIITHDRFIPKEYLPTFNSNTIEMFLPFIPQLSEHFIYSNDDLIFLNPTEWTDFFLQNGNLRIAYDSVTNSCPTGFRYCCRSTYQAVANLFPKQTANESNYYFFKQFHGAASPRLLRDCLECFIRLRPKIIESLTQFRNCAENFNQYLFGFYSIFKGNAQKIENNYIGKYLSMESHNIDNIIKCIQSSKTKMVCINDTAEMTEKAISRILEELEDSFDVKSNFEL